MTIDTFNVVDNYETLVRFYWRIDTIQTNHFRYEYDFIAFLGDIGGIYQLLFFIAIFILGGFMSFNSSIEILKEVWGYDEVRVPTIRKQVTTTII